MDPVIDFSAFVSSVVAVVGTALAAVVAAYFAFLAVRIGCRWSARGLMSAGSAIGDRTSRPSDSEWQGTSTSRWRVH